MFDEQLTQSLGSSAIFSSSSHAGAAKNTQSLKAHT
jgi:hypothetical protein